MRFQGRTVVVTGASMGIGEAIAEAFAAQGADLVLAARSRDLLEALARRLADGAGRVVVAPCDVEIDEDVRRLAGTTLGATGRVDVVVNNAGIGVNGTIEEVDLDAWRRCLEVNLFGPVRVARAFLPAMKAARAGTIVQISSVLGDFSVPGLGGYAASKHALDAATDSLRLEVAPFGIRVVNVRPGTTESRFRENALGEVDVSRPRLARVSAARVGRRVVRAVVRGERDAYVTWKDAAMCRVAVRWPWFMDRILRRVYRLGRD